MTSPTQTQIDKLQAFYMSTRDLLEAGVVPPMCIQRSFEAIIAGIQPDDVWRSTHITREAVGAIADGNYRVVQRAHGVLGDRMDRYDRTIAVLTGPVRSFQDWWSFWQHHDETVLATKSEHGSGVKFREEELIVVPRDARKLFASSGFSFRVRKSVEVVWARSVLAL